MADAKIKINDIEYPLIALSDMTLGEQCEVEEVVGQGYDLEKGGAKALLALAYISVKRVKPDITLDDLRVLTGADLDIVAAEVAPPVPPENAAGSNENGESGSASSEPSSAVSPAPSLEVSGSPV